MVYLKISKVCVTLIVGFILFSIGFLGGKCAYGTKSKLSPPLPESRNFPRHSDPCTVLVDDGKEALEFIFDGFSHRIPALKDNLLAIGNFEVAQTRLEHVCTTPDSPPLVLASLLVPRKMNNYTLLLSFLAPNRETNAIVLYGKTPSGRKLKVIYEIAPKSKGISMVSQYGLIGPIIPSEQFLKEKKATRIGDCDQIQLTKIVPTTQFPDLVDPVVAIIDRNGLMSNYVPVLKNNETVFVPTNLTEQEN